MNGKYVEGGKPHLVLSEVQLNCVMWTRNEGNTYPAYAINRHEWKIYEDAGYIEIGNSRLLYIFLE